MRNQKMFTMPTTPRMVVTYEKDGVKYAANIPTPRGRFAHDQLVATMLSRHVGLSQVKAIAPSGQ